MEAVWRYFKVKLPSYLGALPLPKTFGGFAELSREEWMTLFPFLLFLLVLLYLLFSPFLNFFSVKKRPRPRINRKQKMDKDEVRSIIDIEEIVEQKAFCRCWKSKKFPYCDGSHRDHNKLIEDNVGPLVITCKKK